MQERHAERGSTALEVLRGVAKQWDLTMLGEDIDVLMAEQKVNIGFLGDFSSGKSTLINELTEVDGLMPAGLEPTTANAALAESIPGLDAPEWFRVDDQGDMTPISRSDFDDLARGRGTGGRPLVRLPSRPGFPAGFVFLDTPGLESLIERHTEITMGQLSLSDAAVVCVDIRKGGLTGSVVRFLDSQRFAHLRNRLLIALTFSDKLAPAEREQVTAKVAGTLSQAITCSRQEAEHRIVAVSAGPHAAPAEVSGLRGLIDEVFESRKASLLAERQARGADRLVRRAIALLEDLRGSLDEEDDDFAERIQEARDQRTQLDEELHRQRERLDRSQDALRRDVQIVCDRFRSQFVASDGAEEEVGAAFHAQLEAVIHRHLQKFGNDAYQVGAPDQGLQQELRNISTGAKMASFIATAALGAALGWVAGLGAAVGGVAAGGARQIAAKAGTQAAAKAGAQTAAAGAATGTARTMLMGALQAVHRLNPVNIVVDLFAMPHKERTVDEHLQRIGARVATEAGRIIETWFESEAFQPRERELEEAERAIKQVRQERDADRADRADKLSHMDRDIERLRNLEAETVGSGDSPTR